MVIWLLKSLKIVYIFLETNIFHVISRSLLKTISPLFTKHLQLRIASTHFNSILRTLSEPVENFQRQNQKHLAKLITFDKTGQVKN